MYNNIVERTLIYARYIIDNKTTIRDCAQKFNTAKSTVHFDLKYRLPYINKELAEQVKIILNYNFEQKHIRGGESTRIHYLEIKEQEFSK